MALAINLHPELLAGRSANGRAAPRKRGAPHPPWAPFQRAPAGEAGLPERLRSRIEAMSGLAMDDVRVHRNSTEPARLGALAFAQGTDIHLGPGHERHLPHEAWHVVQQKQGRVAGTGASAGPSINADPSLEAEASRLGARCALAPSSDSEGPVDRSAPAPSPAPASGQRVVQCQAGEPKDDKPKSLEEQVVWERKYKGSQKVSTPFFDVTTSLVASVKFEQKQLSEAAEALTKVEMKKHETTVGVKINLTGKDMMELAKALWSRAAADRILDPGKAEASLKTVAGKYEVETKTSPLPLTIETNVKPKDGIVYELGGGLRAVAKIEFAIKAVEKDRLVPRGEPQGSYHVDPRPAYVSAILALLALIAEYWWVPLLAI